MKHDAYKKMYMIDFNISLECNDNVKSILDENP